MLLDLVQLAFWLPMAKQHVQRVPSAILVVTVKGVLFRLFSLLYTHNSVKMWCIVYLKSWNLEVLKLFFSWRALYSVCDCITYRELSVISWSFSYIFRTKHLLLVFCTLLH